MNVVATQNNVISQVKEAIISFFSQSANQFEENYKNLPQQAQTQGFVL